MGGGGGNPHFMVSKADKICCGLQWCSPKEGGKCNDAHF